MLYLKVRFQPKYAADDYLFIDSPALTTSTAADCLPRVIQKWCQKGMVHNAFYVWDLST